SKRDWSSDVCSSDLARDLAALVATMRVRGLIDEVRATHPADAGEPPLPQWRNDSLGCGRGARLDVGEHHFLRPRPSVVVSLRAGLRAELGHGACGDEGVAAESARLCVLLAPVDLAVPH